MLRPQNQYGFPRSILLHGKRPISMSIIYSDRQVAAHGSDRALILAAQEAPGEVEDALGICTAGPQGGQSYRAFWGADWNWVRSHSPERQTWANKATAADYRGRQHARAQQIAWRDDFLAHRSRYITFTNACDRMPLDAKGRICAPAPQMVLARANQARLKAEIGDHHRVLLICGERAWLAYTGKHERIGGFSLKSVSNVQQLQLSAALCQQINTRMGSGFTSAWYLGHSRNWHQYSVLGKALKQIGRAAGWFPLRVQHFLYFPTAKDSKAVADQLSEQGYTVERRKSAQRKNWFVLVEHRVCPGTQELDAARESLERLAQEHSGEYNRYDVEGTPGPG